MEKGEDVADVLFSPGAGRRGKRVWAEQLKAQHEEAVYTRAVLNDVVEQRDRALEALGKMDRMADQRVHMLESELESVTQQLWEVMQERNDGVEDAQCSQKKLRDVHSERDNIVEELENALQQKREIEHRLVHLEKEKEALRADIRRAEQDIDLANHRAGALQHDITLERCICSLMCALPILYFFPPNRWPIWHIFSDVMDRFVQLGTNYFQM